MNRKSDTVPVPIGKGLWRIIVASAKTRSVLGEIEGVELHETRVIFPVALYGEVKRVLAHMKRVRKHREDEA